MAPTYFPLDNYLPFLQSFGFPRYVSNNFDSAVTRSFLGRTPGSNLELIERSRMLPTDYW